ncbi:MAG: DNA repair protein RecO [Cytophagia bacterium]|nr:DNA repair protein RecO [Cytophagia bacterium]
MITKTRGIYLSHIKYGETSIICKIFTESLGLQSFIVNGIRKSKSKNIGLFQPLNIMDMVVYLNKKSELHRIKEIKPINIYSTLHNDISKISMCFFLSEFLSKICSKEENQGDKFEFIVSSFKFLDSMEDGYSNFHIQFLLKFLKFFGFELSSSMQISRFDSLNLETTTFIDQCIKNKYDIKIDSNNILRNKVINLLIEYYSRCLDININLKSTTVLKNIFK